MNFYKQYIKSYSWKKKRLEFIQASKNRCMMFPFLKAKYVHHMHYRFKAGNERICKDVLVLSGFAHYKIIHGLLSCWKRPYEQNIYPNMLQRITHLWCQIPVLVKFLIIVLIMVVVL